MKILYFIHQFFPMHYTGTEKVLYNLASMMQRFGHKVKVLTYSFYDDAYYDHRIGDFLAKEFTYQGILVLALKHRIPSSNLDFRFQDSTLVEIARELIEIEHPDIIHVMHPMRVGEFLSAALSLNIPYVVTVTDFWLLCPKIILVNSNGVLCTGPRQGRECSFACPELKSGLVVKRLNIVYNVLYSAKQIIAPSLFVANIFKSEMPDLDISVINHGLRYNKLTVNEKKYKKGDLITFCVAGSLNHHKGVHIAVEAFKKVRSNNVALHIYGSGYPQYTKSLQDLVQNDRRIHFRGVYSENQMSAVFNEVDVIIIPSLWYETYSLILHEALSSKIPVIATDTGVMAEAIMDGVNGFTFKLGDTEQLKSILESLASDPERLNDMKNNMKTITPSIEQEAYAYHQMYRDVLMNSRPASIRRDNHAPFRKTKVLLITHEFFPESTGGVEVLTLNTAKTLRRRGYDVSIFTGYASGSDIDDKDRFDRYIYEGLPVERYKHSPERAGSQTNPFELEYNNLFFASYFKAYLKKTQPDIVHFFHLHRITASAIDVCVELGIPTVYTATDFWPICPLSQLRQVDNSPCGGPEYNAVNCIQHIVRAYQPPQIREKMEKFPRWLFLLGVFVLKWKVFRHVKFTPNILALVRRPEFMMKRLNQVNFVLVPTHLMGKLLVNHGLNKAQVHLQHFGIDIQLDNSTEKRVKGSNRKLVLGFIGALFEHKGAHLLIQAISSLPRDVAVDLNIYGNLKQCPEYGELLKKLSADDDRIKFCDTFPNNIIGAIFSELDVLVVPSIWYENTPLVIYSAQAFGCPVIATNLGGMSEVIHDGVNGLLFEQGNVKSLSEVILRLYKNRSLIADLANNAIKPKNMDGYVDELTGYYSSFLHPEDIRK